MPVEPQAERPIQAERGLADLRGLAKIFKCDVINRDLSCLLATAVTFACFRTGLAFGFLAMQFSAALYSKSEGAHESLVLMAAVTPACFLLGLAFGFLAPSAQELFMCCF